MKDNIIITPGSGHPNPQMLAVPGQAPQQREITEEELFVHQSRQFLAEVRMLANVLFMDNIRQKITNKTYSDCCDTAEGTLKEWDSWSTAWVQKGLDKIANRRKDEIPDLKITTTVEKEEASVSTSDDDKSSS